MFFIRNYLSLLRFLSSLCSASVLLGRGERSRLCCFQFSFSDFVCPIPKGRQNQRVSVILFSIVFSCPPPNPLQRRGRLDGMFFSQNSATLLPIAIGIARNKCNPRGKKSLKILRLCSRNFGIARN
jgi:hypothetical protein